MSKDTINRLQPYTAATVLSETLPGNGKPLQVDTLGETARAIHGTSYTRLYNADLLAVVREFATDFQPPQTGINGRTGLYCREQDMFCFLIDLTGWAEIDGEAFAPVFFIWNSEVGCHSVGVKTFWFQKVCQNHIVWDATEVVEFTRNHTAKEALTIAEAQGTFTIFAVVDAITRLTGRMKFAGDRAEADQKAGNLLALVA